MHSKLPIGSSDFAQIRREGLVYVDKTALVSEIVRSNRRVVLLPRPRRFGKTLNLTMLRAFFERGGADATPLFEGLAVASAGPDVAEHFQRHPVITLSFKDVKHASWEDCQASIARVLAAEVLRLRETLADGPVQPEERELLDALARRSASSLDMQHALSLMVGALATATGEPVVILIDEYDTPIHAGFVHGYYEEVVSFFRNLLSAGLKDSVHLYRGVITGILRVAKESIFSGLNNVAVHTVLSGPFAEHFGFTEDEVGHLCQIADGQDERGPVREWYDGYCAGEQRVYNPWSVLNYLANPGDGLQPYWVNTASDEILRDLIIGGGLGLHDDLSALIRGETITRPISEEIVLRDVRHRQDAVWSFLLFCGYLTADHPRPRLPDGRIEASLRVPNREVASVYRGLFTRWMESALSTWSDAPQRLCKALLHGDAETFETLLERLIIETQGRVVPGGGQPEAVYQAFIVGLLVLLQATHDVWSERDGGLGRYDVMVRPRLKGQPGAVLELKLINTRRGETPEQALDRAMSQVRDKRYAAELNAAGADPVWQWGAVFDGKRAWVRVEQG